jgi:histidinol dehydrogenase
MRLVVHPASFIFHPSSLREKDLEDAAMASLNLRRLDSGAADFAEQLAALRNQITSLGDVVSPRSRELTVQVFGEPLTPAQVVERICRDVRQRKLEAVLHYTEQLDGVRLTAETVRVGPAELAEAHAGADRAFLDTVRRIRQNVTAFQVGVLHRTAVLTMSGRYELQLRYRPVRRAGICVPGGGAAYPSTLLMTICPAQAAGVGAIAVVMPPTPTGAGNRDLLAVCQELGVSEVYRVGGAQAVAMLAYGVEGVRPVDMIVGPGNLFVTLAKKHVFGQVGIDCLAGPSEIVVMADDSAQASYVAADLLAQAEHAPGVSILVTWHAPLVKEVAEAVERQLAELPRGQQARDSLERYGALVRVRDAAEAVRLVNELAPEHLHIETRDPAALADKIDCAGAIFLGLHSPVALGDYAAGPSHVLPTGGTARFASGLTANDFLRRSSILQFTPAGMRSLAEDVRLLAEKEGLTAHSASVDVRLATGQHDGMSNAVGRSAIAGHQTPRE